MKSLQPAIKWSGSKRPIAKDIVSTFPKNMGTYYEPFCGGCSVLYYLLNSSECRVARYICSDINPDLISLWIAIKSCPLKVVDEYTKMWKELSLLNIGERKEYFGKVRARFNMGKSPYDFMFIMRTTTNGMPRYNKSGEFNNSFHVTRQGIKPEEFKNTIFEWNWLLNENDVQFEHQDYKNIVSNKNDVVYLDPPYAGTKGMYYGTIDYDDLWNWIEVQKGFVVLSFDGKTTTHEYDTNIVPEGLFKEHRLLYSGNSSFRRTIGSSNKEYVHESLYIK